MKELSELETYEVSLVPKGANGKKFLVFKNLKGKKPMPAASKEVRDWVLKASPEVMKKVEEVLKEHGGDMEHSELHEHQEMPLSDKHKAALQAIARIAAPMKDEVHPSHLMKVLHAAGYDMKKASEIFGNPDGDRHEPDGEPPSHERDSEELLGKIHMKAIPQEIIGDMKDVLKEKMSKGEQLEKSEDDEDDEDDLDEMDKAIKSHMKAAHDEAGKAYKAHMEKLGYRKYPDAEVRMKGVRKDLPKQVDVSEENHEHGEAQPMDKIAKNLDPKIKAHLESVSKATKEAVAKAEKLEKELNQERETRRHKELVEKAEKLGVGAKTDELVAIMKALPADQLEKFEGILKGAGEQIKKGKLFEELGGSGMGAGGDTWNKIEKLAESRVTKGENKTKADAIEAVLKTEEGQKLYAEYKGSRKDGI